MLTLPAAARPLWGVEGSAACLVPRLCLERCGCGCRHRPVSASALSAPLSSDLSAIILAIISFLSGLGWMLDRKKHRQEIESLKADNRQKDMNLSRDYVTEWRTYIAEPLAIAFLCHDSAMSESELSPLLSLLKVDFVDLCRDSAMSESELSPLRSLLHRLQREVGELRQEVAELRHAIQAINFVFLGRDSAIPKQAWMALAAPSVHRHCSSSETVVILRGKIQWVFYDENGKGTERVTLDANGWPRMMDVERDRWMSNN